MKLESLADELLGAGEPPLFCEERCQRFCQLGAEGDFPGKNIVELQMIGTIKQTETRVGDIVAFPLVLDVPVLEVGKEYLLLTSLPGPVGLSATIGLGQGCFLIFQQERQDVAVNAYGNLGLFAGPVLYDELAAAIQDALASAP